ncbi:MAG: AAA family ATPase, partial [bacterium]|nr:AAA family ATPase [Candidatus Kapabacteria bacterium]
MIGRSQQLANLQASIDALFDGTSTRSVLFVTGEAGIGKSTLLDALRTELMRLPKPPVVALAACSTPVAGQEIGGVEALEPWARIMASLVTTPSRSQSASAGRIAGELALAWIRVIPVVGDILESAFDTAKIVRKHSTGESERNDASAISSANQQQMFQQYVNFLAELSKATPLVLMLDDAHWADASSANLLFAAARQLAGHRVAFVVAYRPDDAATGRNGVAHPIVQIRSELERYSLTHETGVPTMSVTDVDALLNSRYPGHRNDDDFKEWLTRISNGNPLFVTQYLATLEEDGFVDAVSGEIRNGYQSVTPPASANAVIEERVRRLSSEMRELLRYASVEGDTFTSTVLGRVLELPQLKLLQRLRLIEESHTLVRALGRQRIYSNEMNAWRFTHILVQRALYDGLDPDERRMIHEIALGVLKEEWQSALSGGVNIAGIAARMAAHAEIVGDNAFAAMALLEGARASWRAYGENESLRMLDDCERSLDRVRDDDGSTDEIERMRLEGMMLRADIDFHRGRLSEASDGYHRAQAAAAELSDEKREVDAANGFAATAYWHGEYDAAMRSAHVAIDVSHRIGYAQGEAVALGHLGHT